MGMASVLEPDIAKRKVYLPKGQWIHLFSGDLIEGEKWVEADTPEEEIPVYFRKGTHEDWLEELKKF